MANDQMTFLDYANTQKTNYLLQGFANAMLDDDSPGGGMGLLNIFPIMSVDSLNGMVNRITNEGNNTPTSRAIGGTYNTGFVTIGQEQVGVGIYGQDVPIDLAFLKKTSNYFDGASPQEFQTRYLAARMNRLINDKLMNGSKAVDPNGFNGLRYWVHNKQIIRVDTAMPNASSYNNGLNIWSSYTTQKGQDFRAAMSRLIQSVAGQGSRDNVYLIMNYNVRDALANVLINTTGLLTTTKDAYDRTWDSFMGCKIIVPGSRTPVVTLADAYADANSIIPNNITFGGSSTSTYIYCVKVGKGNGVVMLEYNPLDVRVVAKELSEGPQTLIRADWYPGFYRFKEQAIARLDGVIAV